MKIREKRKRAGLQKRYISKRIRSFAPQEVNRRAERKCSAVHLFLLVSNLEGVYPSIRFFVCVLRLLRNAVKVLIEIIQLTVKFRSFLFSGFIGFL